MAEFLLFSLFQFRFMKSVIVAFANDSDLVGGNAFGVLHEARPSKVRNSNKLDGSCLFSGRLVISPISLRTHLFGSVERVLRSFCHIQLLSISRFLSH